MSEYIRDPIPAEWARRIWQVLVGECGCRDDPRDRDYSFIGYLGADEHGFGHEYRFQGDLGFGGKFYNDHNRWRVGCYPEDRTVKREAMIAAANARLAALRAAFIADRPAGDRDE